MLFSLRKNFILFLVFTLAISATLFGGGGSDSSPASDSVSVGLSASIELKDAHGRSIILEEPAKSVISLAPGITETVFALGYGDRLVGRTSYCDYPPEAVSVADMGSLSSPNIEAIIAADPDLVIASTHFTEEALASLENAGLNVAVFMGQEDLEGVYDGVIRPVAAVLGDIEAGETMIAEMKKTTDAAIARASVATVIPQVYYVVGYGESGEWTAGGDTFIGQMIDLAGGGNIASDVIGWAFSTEAIIERDPDLILIPAWAQGAFETTEPYASLRAVKNGMVKVIDENAIVRQGPRQAVGFTQLVDLVELAH